MSFATVLLMLFGVLVATIAAGALVYGLWIFASRHKQQPKFAPFVFNLIILTCLPAGLTLYLVHDWLVMNDERVESVQIVFSLGWSLACLCLIILFPVCRGDLVDVRDHALRYLIIVAATTCGLSMFQQGIWNHGRGYKYVTGANMVGWEPVDDYNSLISVELSNSCQVTIEMNCADFEEARSLDHDDDDYMWSYINPPYGWSFSCSNGVISNSDDDQNVEFDWSGATAYSILGNEHACKAEWLTTRAAKNLPNYPSFNDVDEGRFGARSVAFGIITLVLGALEWFRIRRQRSLKSALPLETSPETYSPPEESSATEG